MTTRSKAKRAILRKIAQRPAGERPMTNTERDKCRKLQDLVIALAEQRGLQDQDRISLDLPAAMTLGNLRQYLYPLYQTELMGVLREIDR